MTSKKPKVSVMMSVYNAQKYIKEAINSILSQTFNDFEFIIIDDSSTDNSLEIARQYAKKDRRIRLIRNKTNLGLTRSLNKAIKLARGNYIARQDADDFSEKNRLESQFNFLEENKDIFLCSSGFFIVDEQSRVMGPISKEMNSLEVKRNLQNTNCLCGSFMFRNDGKTLYLEKFIYSQDYDLYLRLLERGKKMACMKEVLYNYRINDTHISSRHGKAQQLFAQKAKEFYLQRREYKKDSYDKLDPCSILRLGEKYPHFILTDYLTILALLNSNKRQARKKIILTIIQNKKINLQLIKYFIKSFLWWK